MLLRQFTEVFGGRAGNALGTVRITGADAGVSQRFAQYDQVGFAASGFVDEWCELAASIHRRFGAARAIVHGSEPDFTRRGRFGWQEGNVTPFDAAPGRPQ